MAKRTYDIRKFYVVTCSECNENICERSDEPTTRAEAEQDKRDHEAQHLRDEGRPTDAERLLGVLAGAPVHLPRGHQ